MTMLSKLVPATFAAAIAFSLVAAPDAHAAIRMNLAAAGACKAASGTGASVFYFDSQYVQNTSASTQYLTCAVPELDPGSARAATQIDIVYRNPTGTTATFTCVLQAGYPVFGANSATAVTNVPASSAGSAQFTSSSTPAMPARGIQYDPYTFSCAIPASGRVELITAIYPETL